MQKINVNQQSTGKFGQKKEHKGKILERSEQFK